jgi:hypothetical protein
MASATPRSGGRDFSSHQPEDVGVHGIPFSSASAERRGNPAVYGDTGVASSASRLRRTSAGKFSDNL